MKILICGAGMGGLVLAHALRHVANAEVHIIERDGSAQDTGGYRISITDQARQILADVLTPKLMAEIESTSDTGTTFRQFTIANAQLRPIIIAPEPPDSRALLAHRRALRVLLARDLSDQIRYSNTLHSVSVESDHATAVLRDGTTLSADLIVAADGAGSPTLTSLLGAPPASDIGVIGIAGSTPMSEPDTVPNFLRRGPALAFSATGTGMFLSLSTPPQQLPTDPAVRDLVERPAIIWGAIARDRCLPPEVGPRSSDALQRIVRGLVGAWNPWLSRQVESADPTRTDMFRFRAIDPRHRLWTWETHRVVALGDSIHAMPPTGGRGASTAILDAGDLATAITDHLEHHVPLTHALSQYRNTIDLRARDAVRESLGPVRIINALQHRPAQLVARPFLAAAGWVGTRLHQARS